MTPADLRYYVTVLLKRLPALVLCVVVFTLAAAAIAFLIPPSYRATATIVVEAPQIPVQLARSTVPDNAAAQLQLIEQQLLRRDALLNLAEELQIYPDPSAMTPTAMANDMHERINIDQVRFGPDDQAIIAFDVSFTAPTPDLAATAANTLVARMLEKDAQRRHGRATETLEFFRQDVEGLALSLRELENDILAFKNQNIDTLPESLLFRREQQTRQQDQLLRLEQEEASLRSRRSNLLVLFETTGRLPDSVLQSPEDRLLADLHLALATQMATFSADSAPIKTLRTRIKALEEALPPASASTASDTQAETQPDTGLRRLPAELSIQVGDIDDRLRAIAREKTSINEAFDTLRASIEATPENETSLMRLERDRDNMQTQYNAAVVRLAEASTGAEIESRLKGERLVLFETALPPLYAQGPRRIYIVAGGMLAGLGAALAGIVGLELLDRRVHRPVRLRRTLGIEVMAVIPHLEDMSKGRGRKKLALTSLVMLALASQSQGPLQASNEADTFPGSPSSTMQEAQPWIG